MTQRQKHQGKVIELPRFMSPQTPSPRSRKVETIHSVTNRVALIRASRAEWLAWIAFSIACAALGIAMGIAAAPSRIRPSGTSRIVAMACHTDQETDDGVVRGSMPRTAQMPTA